MIDQAQFIYSPLQKKAIKDGAERNFRDFRDFKYRSTVKINRWFTFKIFLNVEAKYELGKNKEIEREISRDDLIYKTGSKKKSKAYDFQKLKTRRSSEEKVIVVLLHQKT